MSRTALAAIGVVFAACAGVSSVADGPLVRAHAHNDYEHARPLLDALSEGFCSFEVDVYLMDGRLLVAHDREQARPERTLEALYLDPLRERVTSNGGRVFRGGPECTLLIDVKSSAPETYPFLRGVLQRYADILTTYRDDRVDHRAIAVILSGERAAWLIESEPVRYAALDGTLADLGAGSPAALVPWVSVDWRKTFRWDGTGTMPAADLALLRQIVAQAHRQGRRVRFWNAPDVAAVWGQLWDTGVDLINTDDLAGLSRFLRAQQQRPGGGAP